MQRPTADFQYSTSHEEHFRAIKYKEQSSTFVAAEDTTVPDPGHISRETLRVLSSIFLV